MPASNPPIALLGQVPSDGGELSRLPATLREQMAAFSAVVSAWPADGLVLLAIGDPTGFAAGLLACWQVGRTPVVTADLTPLSLAQLATRLCGALADEALPGQVVPDHLPVARLNEIEALEALPVDGDNLRVNSGATALVMFTSGSSGHCKEVPKRFDQLFGEVDHLEQAFGQMVAGRPQFTTVSHFHIYGLLFNILWPLRHGRPLGGARQLYWEEILTRAKAEGGVFVSSPAHLRFLCDVARLHGFTGAGSVFFSSGSPLARRIAVGIENELGAAPIEVFGSTETGGIGWRRQSAACEMGFKPLPGVEVEIDGESHLQVRSPWSEFPAQLVEVGDLAVFNSDGTFSLKGRHDTIVKVAGKRVSVTEMERIIGQAPNVVGVRVFATANEATVRDTLVAVVALSGPVPVRGSDGYGRVINQFQTLLARRFERVTFPRKWRLVHELPVNSQGKTTLAMVEALIDES